MKINKFFLINSLRILFSTLISLTASYGFAAEESGTFQAGGQIQLQYVSSDKKTDQRDSLFFRRLRPFIEGDLYENWKGRLQWDMGKSKVGVKDAYVQYSGFKNKKLTLGNSKAVFSRAFMTSDSKHQLIEPQFVGENKYGSPDRAMGLRFEANNASKKFAYAVSVGSENIVPDQDALYFISPAETPSGALDLNEGWLMTARVDLHPFGSLPLSQGQLKKKTKATISLAAMNWHNDGDNNIHTLENGIDDGQKKPDVDGVKGYEASAALRWAGFSLDAQYNTLNVSMIAPAVTGGLYKAGKTTLTQMALEGGYMIWPNRVELVGGYEIQDADKYAAKWDRKSAGVNLYLSGHDIKAQVTYRKSKNVKGKIGDDQDEVFVQTQILF
ncbi:MAG: porin [Nitrospirota bacterium]